MFVIDFKTLGGKLNIDVTAAENLPSDSPILLSFTEEGSLTKHQMLKRVEQNLSAAKYEWLRPFTNLTGEWLIDLQALRYIFVKLENFTYLKGKLNIEPDVSYSTIFDAQIDEEIVKFTHARFYIYPSDTKSKHSSDQLIESSLVDSLTAFRKDFPDSEKCCFLMMKFEDSKLQSKIAKILKDELKKRNLFLLRADDKAYSEDLFNNIKTYMHGCSFGIALFERIISNDFNPNVSLEVGYMMALKKHILLLKDSNLHSLQTDLVGRLYYPFNVQNQKKEVTTILDKWLKEKEIID